MSQVGRRRGGEGAARTVSRRSLLQWLGTGSVLALGGIPDLGCDAAGPAAGEGPRADGGAGRGPDRGDGAFPFYPPAARGGIFRDWGERTVDRQDLPRLLAGWTLRVDGLVQQARTYSFAELLALPRAEQVTDFHCVEGWSVLDVPWSGVRLSLLLDRAQPLARATHLTFHTVEEIYNESLPLAVAQEPNTLLGYGVSGNTLPLEHGFPLRLVVPRLLGYKNAKYVYRVELADAPVDGYWVRWGYPYAGEVPRDRLREGKY